MDKLVLSHSTLLMDIDVSWIPEGDTKALKDIVKLNNTLSQAVQISLWMSWKEPVILKAHKTGYDWCVEDTPSNRHNSDWMTTRIESQLEKIRETLNSVGPLVYAGHSLKDIMAGTTASVEEDNDERGTSGRGGTLHGEGVSGTDQTVSESNDGLDDSGSVRGPASGSSEGSGTDEAEDDLGGE